MGLLTVDQCRFVVFKFGEITEMKSSSNVRSAVLQKYFLSIPKQVPLIKPFHPMTTSSNEKNGTIQHLPTVGKRPATGTKVKKLQKFFVNSPFAKVALYYGRVRMIVRKDFKRKPYKPHLAHASR